MNHDRRPARTTMRVAPPASAPTIEPSAIEATEAEAAEAADTPAPPRRRPQLWAMMFFLVPALLGAAAVAIIAQNFVPAVRVYYPASGGAAHAD